MKAQRTLSTICMAALLSPALGGVDKEPEPSRHLDGCSVHLNNLVSYLRETAEIEGVALSIEYSAGGAILNYPEFSQHMQCIDEAMHIDIQTNSE